MIFEMKWDSAVRPFEELITTNIETVYETYEDFVKRAREQGSRQSMVWIYLRDENSGKISSTYVGVLPDNDTTDFVRWLANYAKKDRRAEIISWVADAINKYDNSNPTIKSLIYSLWTKTEGEKT